ncbi:hypothetical protein [Streptomyces nojiriensis]|uniref:hypothetical protein n=1 Tax=Streptomyces nojiriensis TaxID=66374 RepID=UPI0036692EF6
MPSFGYFLACEEVPGYREELGAPLHEVGVGEVDVLGVLHPGSGEEGSDIGRTVRHSDGDAVVADTSPALLVGRVDDQLGGLGPSLCRTKHIGTPSRPNG